MWEIISQKPVLMVKRREEGEKKEGILKREIYQACFCGRESLGRQLLASSCTSYM